MNQLPSPEFAVICLSGGMDSTSLLLHLLVRGCRVYGLSFDYGQKHRVELQRLADNLDYLRTQGLDVPVARLDVSQLGVLFHSALTNEGWDVPTGHYQQDNMKATVVPNRNAIFASVAYGYALSIANRERAKVDLSLGVHSGDHAIYPDCRPEFYQSLRVAFEMGNWESERVGWFLPYLDWDKHRILEDAFQSTEQLGLDFDMVFANTCTSYQPDAEGVSHGLTGSDVERILAFHQLGREDPIQYQLPWKETLSAALKLEAEYKQKSQHQQESQSDSGAT